MTESFDDIYKDAIAAHKKGDLQNSKLLFEKVYDLNPKNGVMVYNYANLLADLGRNQKALEKFDEAISLDPNIPSIHYNKANCLLDMRLYDLAILSYNEALQLKPDYIEVIFNKAVVFTALKKNDQAIVTYGDLLKINPDFHLAHYNIACLYALDQDVDNCVYHLKIAISKQTKDVDYKYEAGLDNDFDSIRHLKKFQSLVH